MPAARHDRLATAPAPGAVRLPVAVAPLEPRPAPAPRRALPAPVRRAALAALALSGAALLAATGWDAVGSRVYAGVHQHRLAAQLAEASPTVAVPTAAGSDPGGAPGAPAGPVPGTAQAAPAPGSTARAGRAAAGPVRAYARITAPAIGLDRVVVAGTSRAALAQGPGWMAGTAEPGEAGNSVVSGHRTSYGAPFRHLDGLRRGDRVTVARPGRPDAVYEVRNTVVVRPGETWVARPTGGARLTLTTCHPAGSDRYRLVVQAELVDGPAAAAAVPAAAWTP